MTKSKNLELYVEFLAYNEPADIPFNEIAAKYSNVTANQLRGMIRSAKHNESIYIALIDRLGYDPEDIPFWFKRPKRITIKKRKRQVQQVTVAKPAASQQPIHTTQPQSANTSYTLSVSPLTHTRTQYMQPQKSYEFTPAPFKGPPIPGITRIYDLSPPNPFNVFTKMKREVEHVQAIALARREAKQKQQNFQNTCLLVMAYITQNQPRESTNQIIVTKEDLVEIQETFKQQLQSLYPPVKETPPKPFNLDFIKQARKERNELFRETREYVKEMDKQNWDYAIKLLSTVIKNQQKQKEKRLLKNQRAICTPNNALGDYAY